MSNLEAIEAPHFDVSTLAGFKAHHLDGLVWLSFLKDQRFRSDSRSEAGFTTPRVPEAVKTQTLLEAHEAAGMYLVTFS